MSRAGSVSMIERLPALHIRPAAPADEDFFAALYRSTRADLLALLADKRYIEGLIATQRQAQVANYRERYPDAVYQVLALDGAAAGRLVTACVDRALRVVDLAVMPWARRRGVAAEALLRLQDEAQHKGQRWRWRSAGTTPAHAGSTRSWVSCWNTRTAPCCNCTGAPPAARRRSQPPAERPTGPSSCALSIFLSYRKLESTLRAARRREYPGEGMEAAGFSQCRRFGRAGREKRRGRESGAVAIMAAAAIILIICFYGLALDLSRVYNRKIELQTVADSLALAAAVELNGTDRGIAAAINRATERLTEPANGRLTYHYGTRSIAWSDSAISFGPTPNGPWKSRGETTGQAGNLLYVRIDTSGFGENYGKVDTFFTGFFSDMRSASTGAHAVAGRSALNVTPLGICALRPTEPRRDRKGELEEFGFRRGVSYNLMQLGPSDTVPAETYLINPRGEATASTRTEVVAPYVCTGTVDMVRMKDGQVPVSAPFPLGDLHHHLNSRFDIYTAPVAACKSATAPPDVNIRQYSVAATGGVAWMSSLAGRLQAAAPSTADGKRWTVASPETTPGGTTAAMYGPLWAYAKAVRYSSYETLGPDEPAAGYGTYGTTDWGTLYEAPVPPAPALSSSPGYPSRTGENTPYLATTTNFARSPSLPGVRGRRVLNLPLLSCPVSGGSATVLGIGKFFMTVQASNSTLYAEFGGLASEASLGTRVELYP